MKTIAKLTLFISALFILVATGKAQQITPSIQLNGIVTNGGIQGDYQRMEDVCIRVYEYNNIIEEYQASPQGKFEFTIPVNTYIVVEFSQHGYISKRMIYDSRTATKLRKNRPFNLEIVLLNELPGIDYSELDFPITIVEFNEEHRSLNYDHKYTQTMLTAQNHILAQMKRK